MGASALLAPEGGVDNDLRRHESMADFDDPCGFFWLSMMQYPLEFFFYKIQLP